MYDISLWNNKSIAQYGFKGPSPSLKRKHKLKSEEKEANPHPKSEEEETTPKLKSEEKEAMSKPKFKKKQNPKTETKRAQQLAKCRKSGTTKHLQDIFCTSEMSPFYNLLNFVTD